MSVNDEAIRSSISLLQRSLCPRMRLEDEVHHNTCMAHTQLQVMRREGRYMVIPSALKWTLACHESSYTPAWKTLPMCIFQRVVDAMQHSIPHE